MSNAASSFRLATGLAVLMATGDVEPASARDRTDAGPRTITITLRVYDYVRLDRPRLLAAEGEATAILAQAGIAARWMDCPKSQAEFDNYPDYQSVWRATEVAGLGQP